MLDRHMIPLIVFGSLLAIMFCFIVVSFLIIHRQRLRQHKAELKEKDYQFSNVLLRTRIEMQEHAMKIMSQEVHDNVNQVLGITKLLWEEAIPKLPTDDVKTLIRQSAERLGTTITDLRNMSHLFNGQMIGEMGLEEAITKELEHVKSLHKLQWIFRCPNECPLLGPENELLIFRIVQEAIYNIVQHAGAMTVVVSLNYMGSKFELIIEDDGRGFDVNLVRKANGLGIVNMKERAACLNGILEFDSRPGRGTKITLTLNTRKLNKPIA